MPRVRHFERDGCRAFTLYAMAKLRLFANLRQIAGRETLEVPADTIAEAIESAVGTYGPEFAAGVEATTVWRQGVRVVADDVVAEDDEIVLLPAVSGGSQPVVMSRGDLVGLLPLAVVVLAILASLQTQEIWAAALVAIVGLWAVDLTFTFTARGRPFAPLAVTATAAACALVAHALGAWGYGIAVALAVAVCLGWAVAFEAYRQAESFAPMLLAGLLGGLAAASMVLSRSVSSPDEQAVTVFLVSVGAGVLAGSVVARMPALPFLEPFTTTAIVAVIGAVVAAAIWNLDMIGYLLVGLGVAVALVAGNGLSTMLRTGQVRLTERAPGIMPSLDGVMLAAAIYFPLTRVIL